MADGGITMYLALASAAASAAAAKQQADAQEATAKYNQTVAQRNANIKLDEGNQRAGEVSKRNRKTLGTLVAIAGQSGLTSDSTLDVFAEALYNGAADRQQAALNAEGQSRQARLQAQQFGIESDQARRNGNASAASIALNAGAGYYQNRQANLQRG